MALLAACIAAACGDDGVGSDEWRCDITLEADGQTGRGSGTGATQEEALGQARRAACSQLGLDSSGQSRCEAGQNPGALSWSIDWHCED